MKKFFILLTLINFLFFNFIRTLAKPRVSIITSVYNGDKFIENFLKDITQQTIFEQCELILINANSPGQEEKVINKYLKKYKNIIYKKLEKDPGLYAVWNIAVKMASADLITNSNLDDRRSKDSLEVYAKFLEENSDIDLVYSDFYITGTPNETFEVNTQSCIRKVPEFSFDIMDSFCPAPQPMWRKKMHEMCGYFNEDYFTSGDWEMWIRAISKGCKFKKVPGMFCLYYWNPEGLSTNLKFAKIKDEEDSRIKRIYKYLWNKNSEAPRLLFEIAPTQPDELFSVLKNCYNKLSGKHYYSIWLTSLLSLNSEQKEKLKQCPNLIFNNNVDQTKYDTIVELSGNCDALDFGYDDILVNKKNYFARFPKLLFKIPTRSRPEQFFRMLDTYYKNLSQEVPYQFVITCDSDDLTMNNAEVIERLKKYENLDFYFGNSKTKVEAYNNNLENYNFDILVVLADDMEPIVKNYDKIIAEIMLKKFPDFDGVINFNDGHSGEDLNTFPVIGKKYYDRFGYVYHPSYIGLCCDNEFTLVSKILDKEYYSNQIVIKHNHPMYNRDVKYDELYNKYEELHHIDMDNYKARRAKNFYTNIKRDVIWSILICTLEERKEVFNHIYNKLLKQIKENNLETKIEVLFLKDNRENRIGYKRNQLLKNSKGKYICFVDDDDDVHDNYIKLIYDKLHNDPDCVSLKGVMTINGSHPHYFAHSIKYNDWFERDGTYYRPPNHLNIIKRDIAIQFIFPEWNNGEDKHWSMAIAKSGLLKKEEFIEEPYYFYLYKYK